MGRVDFKNPEAVSATVKNCKFESPSNYRRVEVYAPGQSEDITSFKFTFESCEFNDGCKIIASTRTTKDKVDENGNIVYNYDYACWEDPTDNDNWNRKYSWNNSLDNIPAERQAVGLTDGEWVYDADLDSYVRSKGYWIYNKSAQQVAIEFDNYYVNIEFTNCQYAGAALSSSTEFVGNVNNHDGIYYRIIIDGATYRALWDSENGKYVIIPA